MQKNISLGQLLEVIASLGVIAGIVFLGFELRQNNDLIAAEARFNRLSMAVDSWRYNAENADLAELRERARNREEPSRVEFWRVDGSIMAIFVMLDWTFRELPVDSPEIIQVRQVQRYNFANDASFNRVWEARKDTFDPAFVQWIEENVIDYVGL
ncbi:MAG: hypothetical protein ACR2QQ_04415 [Gammaproteobacteria bacterium]